MFPIVLLALSLAVASTTADDATAALALAKAHRERKAEVPAPPPAKPSKFDYRACLAHVEAGGRAILAVGVEAPSGAYSVASLDGFSPGLYECFLDGTPKMQPWTPPKAMTAPPLVQFLGGIQFGGCANGQCPGR